MVDPKLEARAKTRLINQVLAILVQLLFFSRSVLSNFCDPVDCSTRDFPVLHHLLEFAQTHFIELMMPSNHLILCYTLLLLPSIFASIRVFSSELTLHIRWPKYWSSGFSVNPSNEYSELTSFRIDLFDLLAVQGTLKSLPQLHNSKMWILWPSASFMVQLSHPYMTTGNTIALNIWTLLANRLLKSIVWLSGLMAAEVLSLYPTWSLLFVSSISHKLVICQKKL